MTLSLRTSLVFALVLVSFVLPGTAKANTICYPDGCATLNFVTSKDVWISLFGDQPTLAKLVETSLAWANAVGDKLNEVVRDSAGNITFIDCGNSHLHTFVYNCNYQFTCRGSDLVDYCGNVSQRCDNGCSNNACVSNCADGYVMQNGRCVCPPIGYSLQNDKCIFLGCPVGYYKKGDKCIFSKCPAGYVNQDNQCVLAEGCDKAPKCSGDDLVNGCTGETIQTCSFGCTLGACYVVPSPSASIFAVPMLVHSGDTTVVRWTGNNVRSCTVRGTNGNSWTGTSSSGETTSAIHEQTIYTLHCIAFPGANPSSVNKSVTVNLIPTFNEK